MPEPALLGAVHATAALALPAVAVTAVGAVGGPGMTPAVAGLATESPVAPVPFATTRTV